MIEDIRTALADGADVEFDVVVAGSGPAGMTVALALRGSGLKVAVLEAGGRSHPESDELALYDGDITGLPYPLDASRQRMFGGTSNHWGGWCRPLDPWDFRQRDWVPMSGWPFGPDELEPWYREAHRVLEIPSQEYRAELRTPAENLLPADADSGFAHGAFRFSPPTRFARRYGSDLENDTDTTVFLHAAVTGLEHDQGRVRSATVRTLDGQRFSFRARHFVLATGGLEVPRLLLHTRSATDPALGDQSGLLGRCFMEHYGYAPGYVMTRAELKYFRHDGDDGPIMPVLVPSEALMAREHINNLCISLHGVEPDTVWPPEALATPGLARALDRPGWRYRITMTNEPSPNPDSRVTLTDERDALGLYRLRLHWAIRDSDLEGVDRAARALGRWLGASGLGRLQYLHPVGPETTRQFSGGLHHMGTTRMSDDPGSGVVDADCRVHGTDNLHVASSSVFPTSGYANPTLTIVALALRLGARLKQRAA